MHTHCNWAPCPHEPNPTPDGDDVDDVEAHAVWCQCDECAPDRRHDQAA